jgi:hypothetical protein
MEYDIINDLLSSTVGQLFSRERRQLEEEVSKSIAASSPGVPSSVTWVKVEGKQKLDQAMMRLRIDHSTTLGRELPHKSLDELLAEKKRVKNELKLYDNSFKSVFSRLPRREEKEPMRPLYMYYKKLKQSINKRMSERQNAPQPQPVVQSEVASRLNQLKQERAELRAILHNFQTEFSRTNNRRIRYHRDIAPVEREYRRYKEVKTEIHRLEGTGN